MYGDAFADKHTKMTTKMYGANLRQTSKNAKTLESGMYVWAVLKLWIAKTFEKITLFVKTISARFPCPPICTSLVLRYSQ